MYRRVLVALDGSQEAEHGLAHAERAVEAGGEVVLARVVMPGVMGGVDFADSHSGRQIEREVREAVQRPHAEAEAYLTAVAGRLGRSDVRVRTLVLDGPVADRLIEASRGMDLVVMGTHRRPGGAHVPFADDVERVVRDSSAPVLVVR